MLTPYHRVVCFSNAFSVSIKQRTLRQFPTNKDPALFHSIHDRLESKPFAFFPVL
jgi:hypothetical protein